MKRQTNRWSNNIGLYIAKYSLKGRNQMNTNSIVKLFTLVSFFVVTGFTLNVQAADYKNQQECRRAEKKICEAKSDCMSKKGDEYASCAAKCSSQVEDKCADYPDKADNEKGDGACEQAFKDYKEKMGDAQSACESVVGKSTTTKDAKKSCTDKIAACEEMATSTSTQTQQQDNGISSTINIFRSVISGADGEEAAEVPSHSCLVDIDSKDARDAEKEFRDRRKELQDEKKKIEDEAIKDKEDNDKEITRITKEIQELQRNNKETLAKADVKMREQLNASQKDAVDSANRLRKLTTELKKKSDQARALNFSYADRMLDTSVQKQNLRCKAALDQAKSCMIKSAKGIADAACKDFPFTIKSKGPKATAELKAQLKVVNEACYEKEEREKKRLQFDQQEQMKRLMDEATELQAQAKEEGERQQIQSENSQKIQQEAEREKQEAQSNMAEQISTLQGEMAQFAQKLEAKNYRSQERLQKLAQDLQNLELEEKTGKRSKTKLASKAVREANMHLDAVKSQCDCNDDLTASDKASESRAKICAETKKTVPTGPDEKPAKTKGKAKGKPKSAW